MDPKLIAGYFAVGTIWGTTNAFMEQGTSKNDQVQDEAQKKKDCSKGIGSSKEGKKQEDGDNVLKETGSMFGNPRFLIPFLLNQVGGILNNFVVAAGDLSISSPIINCITFIVTYLTQKWLRGENAFADGKFFLGSILIMIGMYLCINK